MRTAAILLLAVLLGGCASAVRREADRLLLAGDASGAAAAYDTLLLTTTSPRHPDLLLFRAATAHALADGDNDRLERSRELLERLLVGFPDSPYRPAATLLRRWIDRLEAQAQLLGDVRSLADEALDSGAAPPPTDGSAEPSASADDEVALLRRRVADLGREIERLHSTAQRRERQLRALRQELEMLKAIDLGQGDLPAAPPP